MWGLIQLLNHLDLKLLSFKLIVTAILFATFLDYLDEQNDADGGNGQDEDEPLALESGANVDGNYDPD